MAVLFCGLFLIKNYCPTAVIAFICLIDSDLHRASPTIMSIWMSSCSANGMGARRTIFADVGYRDIEPKERGYAIPYLINYIAFDLGRDGF